MNRLFTCTIILFFLSSLFPLTAEEAELGPEPYQADEFSSSLLALRRSEVIFFGSIPVTFILSGLGWQLSQAAAAGNYPFSDEQHTCNILITAGVLSLGIALIDYFLGIGE